MSEVVRMQRFFCATSERLFDYFFEPQLIQRWMAPAEMTLQVRELSPEDNGCFQFDLRGRSGIWKWEGYYREIIPYILIIMCESRLVSPNGDEQYVNIDTKIEMDPQQGGTEITLLQTGFFNSEAASSSEITWQQRFSYLAGLIDDENSGNIEEAEPKIGVLD